MCRNILAYQSCSSSHHLFVVYPLVAMAVLGRMDLYCTTKAREEARSPKHAMLDKVVTTLGNNIALLNLC